MSRYGKSRFLAKFLTPVLVLVAGANPYSVGSQQPIPSTAVTQSATAPPSDFRHAPPTQEELDRLLDTGFATTVRVDRVLVPAVVTDWGGKPVRGLKRSDFKIMEDKVPQSIDYFDVSNTERLSIAFLLDVSGSMRILDKLGEAREAIKFFLNGLGAEDRAGLLVFADDQVETLAPIGTRPDVLMAHLLSIKAYGQTALNDAIAAAPRILSNDDPDRKAIVLITDGIDNASKLSLLEATSAARRTDVPIYTIGFASSSSFVHRKDEPEAGTNGDVLRKISSETGGRFYWIDDPDEMKEAVVEIEQELRTQYVLGYTPPVTKCDGTFHKIELKVGKDQYRVRTRKGYVSGPC